MFKNDERYWDINLLNKWFAISSIIFLICTVWIFVDDNDDEFKDYQREFRKMQVQVAQEKLEQQASQVEKERDVYDSALASAQREFDARSGDLKELEDKYGVGSIDLQAGEFIPAPKEEEASTEVVEEEK